jgi:hypothetical protein
MVTVASPRALAVQLRPPLMQAQIDDTPVQVAGTETQL